MHLYKCSAGHLFTSEVKDIEDSCTFIFPNDNSRCFLIGWHQTEICCKKELNASL